MDQKDALSPGAAVGIDEALIAEVVHAFYAEVRLEPVLGPIFERVIGGGWDEHLPRMCDFWSSVLLATGRFRGNPLLAHARIPEIEEALFERWLALFERTVDRQCTPAQAALFLDRARRIARSLSMGVETQRRFRLAPPHRPAAVA